MKILAIEDEQGLQDVIKDSLEKEAYIVETAGDFHRAYEKLFICEYDWILCCPMAMAWVSFVS